MPSGLPAERGHRGALTGRRRRTSPSISGSRTLKIISSLTIIPSLVFQSRIDSISCPMSLIKL
jgi:hypothetical protein